MLKVPSSVSFDKTFEQAQSTVRALRESGDVEEEAKKRRTGRPRTREITPPRRGYAGTELGDALKQRVMAAGQVAERSLSHEIRHRVETTFLAEDILGQAMRLAFGPNSEFVNLIAKIANHLVPEGDYSEEWARSFLAQGLKRAFTCLYDPERAGERFGKNPDRIQTGSIEDRTDFLLFELGTETEWARSNRERLGQFNDLLIQWHNVAEALRPKEPPQPDPEAVAFVERSLRGIGARQVTVPEKVQKPARSRRAPKQKS